MDGPFSYSEQGSKVQMRELRNCSETYEEKIYV